MKVLFIATVTEHINAFHIPYLKWFKEQAWEVHVATYGDDKIQYCDKKYNIAVQRLPFKLNNIKAYFQLKVILEKEKYDIIHGHTPMGGILTRLCGKKHRKNGTKIFYTAHGFHFYRGAPILNWLLYYPMEKWLSKYTDALITMNNEDYEFAQKKMRAKTIYYIHGIGVDIGRFSKPEIDRDSKRRELGIPLDVPIIISIGELSKRKNHQIAIKALSKMKSQNIYYIICGQGKLKEYLIELSKELKVENRVLFLGYRTDTVNLLHMADIFLFPSLQEGLSAALMEAMATGLPCIVSKIRGNVDLIEHGKGGFLCCVNDTDEYRNAIEKIIENIDLRRDMGEYNKNSVQKFDLNNAMQEMTKIYKNGI